MEYKYDYYQRRDYSWFRLILGSFLILGTLWLMIFERVDQVLLNLMYLFLGSFFIVEGLGYQSDRIFGEKFIHIAPGKIQVKKGLFSRDLDCQPSDIIAMDIWPGKITINKQDQSHYTIPLANLSADVRHEILKATIHFADANKIHQNKHGYLQNY